MRLTKPTIAILVVAGTLSNNAALAVALKTSHGSVVHPSAAASPCRLQGFKVRAASNLPVVLRKGGRVFACYLPTGKRTRLDWFEGSFYAMTVTGRFVGFESFEAADHEAGWRLNVNVVDARRGVPVSQTGAYTGSASPHLGADAGVSALIVLKTGFASWISATQAGSYEVRAARPRRRSGVVSDGFLVDSGSEIDPESLAMNTKFVYWTKAGMAVSTAVAGLDP